MRPRPPLFAVGTLIPYGAAGFLPETSAKAPAPATGSLLAAAGKPAFAGPYAELKPHRPTPARAVFGALARVFDWLMESAERARQRELERYLGKSVDLYDLERRLRELEHNRGPIFGSYV